MNLHTNDCGFTISSNQICISDKDLTIIQRELEINRPFEACGVLIGLTDGHTVKVKRTIPIKSANRAERRFKLDSIELYKAWNDADKEGLDIVGIYHSHPLNPAKPSKWDIEYMQNEQHIWLIAGIDGIFAYIWEAGEVQAVEIV